MNRIPKFSPGNHVLLDFFGAEGLADPDFIEQALHSAAAICGATVLDIKLHAFGENGGVTGVALLAESHISIHTWPELNYAALDIFMCGECNAEDAIEPLKGFFNPSHYTIQTIKRGDNKVNQ